MSSTTQINLASFNGLKDTFFDNAKNNLFLDEKILDLHSEGQQIKTLLQNLGVYNKDEIFRLELADGFPYAVYGFTVGLNQSGIPSLMFGSNDLPITISKYVDGDACLKVGDATIEFEQEEQTSRVFAYVGNEQIKVKSRCVVLDFQVLEKVDNIEDLKACLDYANKPNNLKARKISHNEFNFDYKQNLIELSRQLGCDEFIDKIDNLSQSEAKEKIEKINLLLDLLGVKSQQIHPHPEVTF